MMINRTIGLGIAGITMAIVMIAWLLFLPDETQQTTPPSAHGGEASAPTSSEDDNSLSDLDIYVSHYLRRGDTVWKAFEKESGLNLSIEAKSFPLFREDILKDQKDLLWLSHGDYVEQFLKEHGDRYKKVGPSLKQETLLWIEKPLAESMGAEPEGEISWQSIASAVEDHDLKFDLASPVSSASAYAVLATLETLDMSLRSRVLKGLDHLTSTESEIVEKAASSRDVRAFFMDRALAEYYMGQEGIEGAYVGVHLKGGHVSADYQMYVKKGADNPAIDRFIGYVETHEEQIADEIGVQMKDDRHRSIDTPYKSLDEADAAITLFVDQYRPNLHTYVVLGRNGALMNKGIYEMVGRSLAATTVAENASYPWHAFKFGDKASLISWGAGVSDPTVVEMGLESSFRRIGQWLNSAQKAPAGSSLFDAIEKAVAQAERDREDDPSSKSVIWILTGEGFGEISDAADSLESVRRRISETDAASPKIHTLIFGKHDAAYFHSLAGLTGGRVISSNPNSRSVDKAVIVLQNGF